MLTRDPVARFAAVGIIIAVALANWPAASEPSEEVEQRAERLPPRDGQAACAQFERIGNNDARWVQRCTYVPASSSSPAYYSLRLFGDYGDQLLAVTNAAVSRLAELNRSVVPPPDRLRIVLPEGGKMGYGRPFTISLTDVQSCQTRSADATICVLDLLAQGMKKASSASP